MIDPVRKKSARLKLADNLPERDIDRLLRTSRAPGAGAGTRAAQAHRELAARLEMEGTVPAGHKVSQPCSIWDIPVFILYACLGIFTRIWTDVTLYFDFGEDNGIFAFAVGVAIALHMFIFAIIANAWRAKWDIRSRNFLALAVLIGYLGFRTLSHM